MRREVAVVEAIDVFKQPSKARLLRKLDLPEDMLTLIKIAAGDQALTDEWSASCRETPETIRQAAVFYLQQTIAQNDNDSFRTLGLKINASSELVRLHKRWLLKWLHPDLNTSKWETMLFHRVTSVAAILEGKMGGTIDTCQPIFAGGSIKHKHSRSYRRFRTRGNVKALERKISWAGVARKTLLKGFLAFALLAIGWLTVNMASGPMQSSVLSMLPRF
jgi:hypothetical protein